MSKHRHIDDVERDHFVATVGQSMSNTSRAHLPAVDADGVVRPVCEQGGRDDREWEIRERRRLSLGTEKICIGCDPKRERETRTMDFSYQDALKTAAEDEEVEA
jgi:reverse gyrase